MTCEKCRGLRAVIEELLDVIGNCREFPCADEAGEVLRCGGEENPELTCRECYKARVFEKVGA